MVAQDCLTRDWKQRRRCLASTGRSCCHLCDGTANLSGPQIAFPRRNIVFTGLTLALFARACEGSSFNDWSVLPMKLFYMPGACSMAPHLVANEAGIDLDLIKVDGASKKTEADRTISPPTRMAMSRRWSSKIAKP